MNSLFTNAVQSIQIGVEDYKSDDPKRVISAVRNIYAGVLLLAKEALVRSVPQADPEQLLGEKYEPVPDGNGGITFAQATKRTVDFVTLGKRFSTFGLKIDNKALGDLNDIRNDIEHHSTQKPEQAIKEAIAKALPVAADLFRLAGEEPADVLGEAWQIMLEVRQVYEKELAECRATFDEMDWKSGVLSAAPFDCPDCHSDLVQQTNPKNAEVQNARCHCRACGTNISPEDAVSRALEVSLEAEGYIAATDGGESPLNNCPDCGVAAYVVTDEEIGCVWCGFELKDCHRCSVGLTPDNVSDADSELCGYCYNLISKDD